MKTYRPSTKAKHRYRLPWAILHRPVSYTVPSTKPYCTVLYNTKRYYTRLHYTILDSTILYYTTQYYATRCSILYYAILCYTILCYDMLCYAIPYCTIWGSLGAPEQGLSPLQAAAARQQIAPGFLRSLGSVRPSLAVNRCSVCFSGAS